jgi:hypothetical protein
MAKGVGKGIGGVFLKPPAGMLVKRYAFVPSLRSFQTNLSTKGLWGLAGYPLAGLRRMLQTSLGKTQDRRIVGSRIAQGVEEMRASSADERAEVARKWLPIEEDYRVSY